MAKTTTEIVVAEDNTNQPPPPLSKPERADNPIDVASSAGGAEADRKRNFVRFPQAQVADVSALRLEAVVEESICKTSNPIIICQVYAIGAFYVTVWALSRWRERKGRGRFPNDDDRAE